MSWPFGRTDHAPECTVVDGVAGGVPTADTGAPASNIVTRLQSAFRTAASTLRQTLLFRQDGERSVRFLGARWSLSRSSVVRVILGQKAHRYGIKLGTASHELASANVATSAEMTFELIFRINNALWTPGDEALAYHGSAFGGATRDWYIGVEATTGKVHAVFDRYVSSAKDAISTTTVQNGRIVVATIVVSGTTGALYVNGGDAVSVTSIGAHAANSDPITIGDQLTTQGMEWMGSSLWDAALSAAEVAVRYDKIRLAIEADLVQAWIPASGGSGNPTQVVATGVAMTLTGGSYVERANTCARTEDTGAITPHGPWRERQALRMRGATALDTTAALSLSPVQTFWAWVLLPENTPTGTTQAILFMGADFASRDWYLAYVGGGSGLQLKVARNGGAEASIAPTSQVFASGQELFVVGEIDGIVSKARFRVWDSSETEDSSAWTTVPAYAPDSSVILDVGSNGVGAQHATCDLFGDVGVANRLLSDSEIQEIRRSYCIPEGDPDMQHLYRVGDVTTGDMVDHGSAGEDLTVTGETFVPVDHPLTGTITLGHGNRHDGDWGHVLAADVDYEEALLLVFDPANPAGQVEIESFYLFAATEFGEGGRIEGPETENPAGAGFQASESVNAYPYAGREGRKANTISFKATAEEVAIVQAAYEDQTLVAIKPDATIPSALTRHGVVIGTIKSFSAPFVTHSAGPQYYQVAIVVHGLPGWGR